MSLITNFVPAFTGEVLEVRTQNSFIEPNTRCLGNLGSMWTRGKGLAFLDYFLGAP